MSYRPRIIPCLLLSGKGLVKTLRFENPVYIGDPINTVKIFNDFQADELILLDIESTAKKTPIQFDLIKRIAEEAYMPLSYGGGVKTIEQVAQLINSGVEKIVLCSALEKQSELITHISERYGSQAVVACVDIKKVGSDYFAFVENGKKLIDMSLEHYVQNLVEKGAGEIMLQFIEKDGTETGLDQDFIGQISATINVPVIIAGGTDSLETIKTATLQNGASAVAVGSLFSFLGSRNSVMINYPDKDELNEIFTHA